jgi:hypothetical protein
MEMQGGLWSDEYLIELMLPTSMTHTAKVYFVTAGKSDELEVIRQVKPPCLLLSYFYFRNKSLQEFVDQLGYQPEILLDSGAFSSWTTGRNISPIDYMQYIQENKDHISDYVALDVLGDGEITWHYYQIMKLKGFKPIPVYHYGTDEQHLRRYLDDGAEFVALGGTVPIGNKQEVAEWVRGLIQRYPDIKFHVLGASSKPILGVEGLYSCDSSTWILRAANGEPVWIRGKNREAKIKRAIYNMRLLTG